MSSDCGSDCIWAGARCTCIGTISLLSPERGGAIPQVRLLSGSWQLRRELSAHQYRHRAGVAFAHPLFDLLLGGSSEPVEVPRRIRHQRVCLVPDSVFHDVPHSRSSSLALSQLTVLLSIRSSAVLCRLLPKFAVALVRLPGRSSFSLRFFVVPFLLMTL
jgi:hypothetical protein